MTNTTWREYQEQVADFYRGLGLQAQTNVSLEGARAKHDIDVLVTFDVAGVVATWVVECKDWSRPIPKERVLTLEGVVKDVGADRGVLVAEQGFQAGAIRAAQHNNLILTSLADLHENSADELLEIALGSVAVRIANVARHTSALWEWTKPQTPEPAFDFNEFLKLAGTSLELQSFVLPRLIARDFPISLPGGARSEVITDEADAARTLSTYLDQTESEINDFASLALKSFVAASDHVRKLTVQLKRLTNAGFAYSSAEKEEQAAREFLQLMKDIDATADLIIVIVPEPVGNVVRKVMKHLVEYSYAMFGAPNPDWPGERGELDQLSSALSVALEAKRPSRIDDAPSQPESE